jgi:hypothetical protein
MTTMTHTLGALLRNGLLAGLAVVAIVSAATLLWVAVA